MTKTKRNWIIVLLVAALLLAAVFFGGPRLYRLYRDISFRWGEHTEAELRVKEYADEKGVSYSQWPQSLIDLLERNPETEAFVLNYPFRGEQQAVMLDEDLSGGVPLFMQWDTRWGYIQYGSDVVGLTGCGPICLSMAGYYVTGDAETFAPDKIVDFAWKNGYYASGSGSSWTLISEGGVKLGLEVTEIPLVKKRILDNLEAGNPIICAMGKGDFTSSGHYIVLVGTEDGKIRVNDPNSHANSDRLWTYEEMEKQFRNLWVIRA